MRLEHQDYINETGLPAQSKGRRCPLQSDKTPARSKGDMLTHAWDKLIDTIKPKDLIRECLGSVIRLK